MHNNENPQDFNKILSNFVTPITSNELACRKKSDGGLRIRTHMRMALFLQKYTILVSHHASKSWKISA